MPQNDGALWAVTSYFNPHGYRRRKENYRVFRKHLRVPLVCVEQAGVRPFELSEGDAEVLVQLRGGDTMWQKERLLNVALARVPDSCRAVAWVDCDVVFAREDWPVLTLAALADAAMVQLYETRVDLARDAQFDLPEAGPTLREVEAVVAKARRGAAAAEEFWNAESPNRHSSTAGLAWAASRDLLAAHGLYDACILGTGDRVMLCAGHGDFAASARAIEMNDEQVEHFRAWAEPFHADVGGRIGHIPGRLYHLWHGAYEKRSYGQRHADLARFAFDPRLDLALNDNGTWRWDSPKPEMHEYVRDYFATRNEDA